MLDMNFVHDRQAASWVGSGRQQAEHEVFDEEQLAKMIGLASQGSAIG